MANKRANGETWVDGAIQTGLASLVKNHPRFLPQQNYLQGHLSQERLNKKIVDIQKEARTKYGENISEEDMQKLMYERIANYAASGELFDEEGRAVLLGESLKGKDRSLLSLFRTSKTREGDRYFDRTIGAFSTLYHMLGQDPSIAERNPEFAKAVVDVYDSGFFNTSIDVLAHYGKIDKTKYREMKKAIHERAKKGEEAIVPVLDKYFPKKIAALFFGILGIGTIALAIPGITGNVVGISKTASSFSILSGLLFIVIAFFLMRKGNNLENKQIIKKKALEKRKR